MLQPLVINYDVSPKSSNRGGQQFNEWTFVLFINIEVDLRRYWQIAFIQVEQVTSLL